MKGSDSPTQYNYTLELPEGAKLEKTENGEITIFTKEGAFIGGILAPWAIDALGVAVPTSYQIEGDQLIQIVDHLNGSFQYPIIADPWLGNKLIISAAWKNLASGASLRVSPTAFARSMAVTPASYNVGVAGWTELSKRYPIPYNKNSMKNQYICHQIAPAAALKSTWNLDEWRPDVGLLETVNKLCNP